MGASRRYCTARLRCSDTSRALGSFSNGPRFDHSQLLSCTAGQQVAFSLTVTQGGTSGTGRGAGFCTGALTGYAVTVPTAGGTSTPGPAAACATAVNRDQSVVVDTRQWCRADGITLSAP